MDLSAGSLPAGRQAGVADSPASGGFNWGAMNHYFLLTIDGEGWFQVENFKKYIPFDSWPSYELRVEKNTHLILDLFDSIESKKAEVRMQKTVSNNENQVSRIQYSDNGQQSTDHGQDEKVRSTFFVLGWLAERLCPIWFGRSIHVVMK